MDGGTTESPATSTVTVNLNRNGESVPDLTGKIHQLPCCIKYNGPTSVSHYFKPKPTGVEIDGLREEEAYFRGRKLQGTTIPLPQGYSGFVLGKGNSAENTKKTGKPNLLGDKREVSKYDKYGIMIVFLHMMMLSCVPFIALLLQKLCNNLPALKIWNLRLFARRESNL